MRASSGQIASGECRAVDALTATPAALLASQCLGHLRIAQNRARFEAGHPHLGAGRGKCSRPPWDGGMQCDPPRCREDAKEKPETHSDCPMASSESPLPLVEPCLALLVFTPQACHALVRCFSSCLSLHSAQSHKHLVGPTWSASRLHCVMQPM